MALIFGILIPLFFLYVVYLLEIYASSRHEVLVLSIGYGILTFGIAYWINRFVLDQKWATLSTLSLVVAPPIEEALKGLFMIFLAYRMVVRYSADGMAYGFAIGTGFAVIENIAYALNSPDTQLQLVLTRSLSTSLVHGFTTAVVGTVVGATLPLPIRARTNRFLVALLMAVFSHGAFNYVVQNLSGAQLLLTAIAIGLSSIVVISMVMRRTLARESTAIHVELAGLVSAGELAAARNPQRVAQILAQHRGAIGEHRTQLIQRYVTLLAQRGILRKNLVLTQSVKFVALLQRQLQTTEQQLDILRHSMGLYTLLWLRTVLPSEESDLWLQLDNQLSAEQPQLARLIQLNDRQVSVPSIELEMRKRILRQGALFNGLADEDLVDLALLLTVREFRVGDEVVRQGEPVDGLYITAVGSLVVSIMDEQGQQTIITAFHVGDAFGEMEILEDALATVTVACLEEVTLYKLARNDLITLLFAKPQVALEMLRVLSQRMRHQTALTLWVQQTASNKVQSER